MAQLQPINVQEDEEAQMAQMMRKARHKVVGLANEADVHEFEKEPYEKNGCFDGTSSTSTISTMAPTEGGESMCFSGTASSIMDIRQAGEKYRADRQRNLSLCVEEPPEFDVAAKSTLDANAPEFYMTESTEDGKAKKEPLKMEPVKITSTSVGTSPSSRMSDGSVAISRFGVAHVTTEEVISVGSKDHGSGVCKPCAWFHKPGSCLNGKDCCHCHICPPGEIKARKKAKGGQPQPRTGTAPGLAEPAFINTGGEVPQSVFIASDSDSLFATPLLFPSDAAVEPSLHQKKGTKIRSTSKDSKDEKEAAEQPDDEDSDDEQQSSPALVAPPGLPGPIPTEVSFSVGSDKHAMGDCRPCAWYWKPGSCSNGKDCMHCHLCEESEIKKRKKAKLATLRASSKEERTETVTSPGERQKYRRSSRSPQRSQEKRGRDGNSSTPPPPALQDVPLGESGDDQNAAFEEATDLPSSGSALHALGKCKPCAWHWKPGGCTNDKECCHCHLCPPGELKGRRKAKESAMRVGALVPKRAPPRAASNSRAMNVLKIFPLL